MRICRKREEAILLGEKQWPPGTPDGEIQEFTDEVSRALAERGIDPGIVTWETRDG